MIHKEAQAKRILKSLVSIIMDSQNKYVTDGHLALTTQTFAPSTGLTRNDQFDRITISRLSGKEIKEIDQIEQALNLNHKRNSLVKRTNVQLNITSEIYANPEGAFVSFDGNYLKAFDYPEIFKGDPKHPNIPWYCPEHEIYMMRQTHVQYLKNETLCAFGRMLVVSHMIELDEKTKELYKQEF